MALRGTTSSYNCWCCPSLLFLLLFFYGVNVIPSCFGSSEQELLLKFKDSLQYESSNTTFSTWNASVSPPCSGDRPNWVGVSCAEGKISGLKLENMGLKGLIDVDALQELPNLRTLSFINNDFHSTWPDLNKLSPLKTFYLSNNRFYGEIPSQTFQSMNWLKKVHLANNQFSGEIPTSLTMVPRLMELRLEGNKFSGRIPNFLQKELKSFSVANNQLHGEIPASLSELPISSFSGNEGLCGTPMSACHSSKSPSIITIVAIAIAVGVAVILIGVIIFLLRRRKSQPAAASSVENPQSNQRKRARLREVDEGSNHSRASQVSNHSKKSENMKLCFVRKDRERFDLQDLLRASAEILGSGSFSSSYKAALLNGSMMVVKRFKQMNNVGKEEFQEHMRRIGRLDHPNLLPLVAYYYRKEEKLLVTDYVPDGSLAVRLHGPQDAGKPGLDWPTRLKIVKGITKGLEYLYKELPSLIAPHGHLKSSNVLLTQSYEPLLTDYGLVPVMNQELAQDMMVIYRSPDYRQEGQISKKTDIWSFGVLILEIMSGRFAGKGGEMDLVSWVKCVEPEEWSSEVLDKVMGGTRNSEGEMVKLLRTALCCCEEDVSKRLSLKEVVEKIQELRERDHDDDFYSYASEAEIRSSTATSDEINFPINNA
ncbi:pollen receptor-like kinase 1 [Prosopis cineraria]|uniref:pollen receptor-like kinase 1 n=1 Tax=Prosopis cineraria TaxID=364024 RepID=UPI00240F84A5|nr:pollen receptor-like kinase 1 [Prosopis cineraria]